MFTTIKQLGLFAVMLLLAWQTFPLANAAVNALTLQLLVYAVFALPGSALPCSMPPPGRLLP